MKVRIRMRMLSRRITRMTSRISTLETVKMSKDLRLISSETFRKKKKKLRLIRKKLRKKNLSMKEEIKKAEVRKKKLTILMFRERLSTKKSTKTFGKSPSTRRSCPIEPEPANSSPASSKKEDLPPLNWCLEESKLTM